MAIEPPRPVLSFSYTLTSADALAWRKLRNDWSMREMLFGLAIVIAFGAALAALPEPLAGTPFDLRFVLAFSVCLALAYGLFRLSIAVNDRRLARRDIPAPRLVTLENWAGHLDERWEGGCRSVALDMMGPVLETPGHVFVQGPGAVIIIPAAAFAGAAEKRNFARYLEKLADEASKDNEAPEDSPAGVL